MEKNTFEQLRIIVSRIATFLVILLALLSQSSWIDNKLAKELMFSAGLALTFSGCLGRVWCLVHIAGRKNNELITQGPYSLCRNPLYMFSLIGAMGVAFSTCTLSIPLLVSICFFVYYPLIIRSEEQRLLEIHGASFQDYCHHVPRLIPSFRRYISVEQSTIQLRLFGRGLLDVIWFLLAILLSHLNIELHNAGYGITLIRLI